MARQSTSFSGTANIEPSVNYEYSYISGYDNQGNAIYNTRYLPAPVTSISERAFNNCTSLTSVTIPNSVTFISDPNYGIDGAFSGCSSLTSVTIGNSVTSIPNHCFSHCTSLPSVNIPNSVTSIGSSAFYDCSSLTSVTIGNSVTSIGRSAFYDCSSLTSVTIPNSVTSIGNHAFHYCSSLTNVTIGNSVTSIGNQAFSRCSSLTSITIPNSVTTINGWAFDYCSGLTSVTIGNSVSTIGEGAFEECSNLTSITIPNSVSYIGELAFYGCCSLTSVTCLAETPPTAFINSFCDHFSDFRYIVYTTATLYVPEGSLNAYKTTDPWFNFYTILPIEEEDDYSLTLDATSLVMEKGDVFHLKATVTPDDENAPSVTWSSSNSSVASVNDMGFVTAVGTGTATITARAGDATATCQVRVMQHTVTLDQSTVTIEKYATVQLHATVMPNDEYAPTVEWSSDRPGVATVTSTGLVKGYMTGTATITARVGQSTATCVVTVTPVLATSIVLNASSKDLNVGDDFRLVATVYPDNVTNGDVSWSASTNNGVISATWLGNECVITAEKAGTAIVTARTTDGTNLSVSCVIRVKEDSPGVIFAESITLDQSSIVLEEGKIQQLYATVLPANTTNKKVEWSSSNTAVATVTSHGVVRGIQSGIATITATTTDGTNLSATCQVTVTGSGGGNQGVPGDADGDGRITINDVTTLINYLLSHDATGIDLENADVDGDGHITINDVTTLINKLLRHE